MTCIPKEKSKKYAGRLKRRLLLIPLLCLVALCLTGCADVVSHVTVHPDGSADLHFSLLVDKRLTALESVQHAFSQIDAAARSDQATVRQIQNDDEQGVEITKRYGSLQALLQSHMMKLAVQSEDGIRIDKQDKLLTSTYTLRMNAEPTKSFGGGMPSLISNRIATTFELSVPQKAGASNATKVSSDGKDYTWNLAPDGQNEIMLQYEIPNPHNILLLALGLIALLCIVLLGVLLIVTKRRKMPR